MAIIGTYQGASIVALPTYPGFESIELGKNNIDAVSKSIFTGQTQIQGWSGAEFFDASLALPRMTAAEARPWNAWFGQLQGTLNVFYLGDPTRSQPLGSPQGLPLVSGVNAPMSGTLNTKGWEPNSFRLLLPGDLLQIGHRLHEVLDVVNSDASGNAAISIWPSIREATADGDPITLNNPAGLFRLVDNRNSVLTDETWTSGISFKAMEAR